VLPLRLRCYRFAAALVIPFVVQESERERKVGTTRVEDEEDDERKQKEGDGNKEER
jgi:hypothetical protein